MEENYKLIQKLTLAENKIDGVYYLFAKKIGINENTLALLYALDDDMPHSQKEICENWLIPRTTVNTIVKKLCDDGVILMTAETHSKEKNLTLTEKGRAYAKELLGDIYRAENEAMNKTLKKYPPEFADALFYFSKQLQASLENYERI